MSISIPPTTEFQTLQKDVDALSKNISSFAGGKWVWWLSKERSDIKGIYKQVDTLRKELDTIVKTGNASEIAAARVLCDSVNDKLQTLSGWNEKGWSLCKKIILQVVGCAFGEYTFADKIDTKKLDAKISTLVTDAKLGKYTFKDHHLVLSAAGKERVISYEQGNFKACGARVPDINQAFQLVHNINTLGLDTEGTEVHDNEYEQLSKAQQPFFESLNKNGDYALFGSGANWTLIYQKDGKQQKLDCTIQEDGKIHDDKNISHNSFANLKSFLNLQNKQDINIASGRLLRVRDAAEMNTLATVNSRLSTTAKDAHKTVSTLWKDEKGACFISRCEEKGKPVALQIAIDNDVLSLKPYSVTFNDTKYESETPEELVSLVGTDLKQVTQYDKDIQRLTVKGIENRSQAGTRLETCVRNFANLPRATIPHKNVAVGFGDKLLKIDCQQALDLLEKNPQADLKSCFKDASIAGKQEDWKNKFDNQRDVTLGQLETTYKSIVDGYSKVNFKELENLAGTHQPLVGEIAQGKEKIADLSKEKLEHELDQQTAAGFGVELNGCWRMAKESSLFSSTLYLDKYVYDEKTKISGNARYTVTTAPDDKCRLTLDGRSEDIEVKDFYSKYSPSKNLQFKFETIKERAEAGKTLFAAHTTLVQNVVNSKDKLKSYEDVLGDKAKFCACLSTPQNATSGYSVELSYIDASKTIQKKALTIVGDQIVGKNGDGVLVSVSLKYKPVDFSKFGVPALISMATKEAEYDIAVKEKDLALGFLRNVNFVDGKEKTSSLQKAKSTLGTSAKGVFRVYKEEDAFKLTYFDGTKDQDKKINITISDTQDGAKQAVLFIEGSEKKITVKAGMSTVEFEKQFCALDANLCSPTQEKANLEKIEKSTSALKAQFTDKTWATSSTKQRLASFAYALGNSGVYLEMPESNQHTKLTLGLFTPKGDTLNLKEIKIDLGKEPGKVCFSLNGEEKNPSADEFIKQYNDYSRLTTLESAYGKKDIYVAPDDIDETTENISKSRLDSKQVVYFTTVTPATLLGSEWLGALVYSDQPELIFVQSDGTRKSVPISCNEEGHFSEAGLKAMVARLADAMTFGLIGGSKTHDTMTDYAKAVNPFGETKLLALSEFKVEKTAQENKKIKANQNIEQLKNENLVNANKETKARVEENKIELPKMSTKPTGNVRAINQEVLNVLKDKKYEWICKLLATSEMNLPDTSWVESSKEFTVVKDFEKTKALSGQITKAFKGSYNGWKVNKANVSKFYQLVLKGIINDNPITTELALSPLSIVCLKHLYSKLDLSLKGTSPKDDEFWNNALATAWNVTDATYIDQKECLLYLEKNDPGMLQYVGDTLVLKPEKQ